MRRIREVGHTRTIRVFIRLIPDFSELREHVKPRYASQVATNGDSGKSAPKGDDTSSEEANSSSGEEEELSEDDAVHSGQE